MRMLHLWVLLLVVLAPAAAAPAALFSKMGWGTEVYTALAEGSGWWRRLLVGGTGLLVLLIRILEHLVFARRLPRLVSFVL